MNTLQIVLVTIAATTLRRSSSEIAGNYGLGDKVKDLVLRIFRDANSVACNAAQRLEARAAKIRAAL